MATKKQGDQQMPPQGQPPQGQPAAQGGAPQAQPQAKAPVQRKFVDAKTGQEIAEPTNQVRPAPGQAPAVDLDAAHAQRKADAKPFRIVAIILWVLGVLMEVVAINFMNGNIYLPKFTQQTWLIIFLVADFIFVVIGSQLWKRANHINPPSEANKAEYWLQTEAGVIVAIIAFAPIVFVLLNDKKLDKKTRQLVSIIAVVCLAVAGLTGIDFHPTTQEDYDAAAKNAAELGSSSTGQASDVTVYWTTFGHVYHLNPDCQAIKNSTTIYSGTLADAFAAKRSTECEFCARKGGTDLLSLADPTQVAAAAASATDVSDDTSVAGSSDYESGDTASTSSDTTAATTQKAA